MGTLQPCIILVNTTPQVNNAVRVLWLQRPLKIIHNIFVIFVISTSSIICTPSVEHLHKLNAFKFVFIVSAIYLHFIKHACDNCAH